MGQCPRGPGSNLVAAKEGWAVSITQIGGAACRPVGSPNGASGAGCSPRRPATLRVEVGSRAAVRSEGGALGGQRGRPGSRPSGTNRCSRFPWGVEGGPGHPPRGPALGPLADHVPVVGDDRVLQLHHRGEDPLHLQRAGEGVSVAGTPGTAHRRPPGLGPTPGTTRGLGVLVGTACGQRGDSVGTATGRCADSEETGWGQ